MNKKLENFFILGAIFTLFYVITAFVLGKFSPPADGPGVAGLFIIIAPWLLFSIFLITFFSLKNVPLNKNNNIWIKLISIILFFVAFYFVLFGIGLEVGALPLAKFTHSKLICRMIIFNFAKDSCLRDVSALSGDESSCDSIEDSDKKDQCYWRVAEKIINIDLCEKAGGYKDMCVMGVAEGAGNKEYCNYMPENSNFSKDYCRMHVK